MRTFVAKTSLLATLFFVSASATLPSDVWAQTPGSPVAPTLIPVSGRLLTAEGQPRTGEVQLVISLYDGQNDTGPRWIEQQTVTLDAAGGYTVQFGATLPDGLPADLFTTDAGTRWLGVGVAGDPEQPRAMLVSVPYAAKAASAETLGGKSAADFMLTSTFRDDLRTVLQEEGVTGAAEAGVGTEGTLNFIQKSDGTASGIVDSALFEIGGNVGVGTTTPQTLFHLRAGANLPAFRLENTEAGGASWQITSASDGQLRFTEVGAAVRMVVNKTTGAVGIGSGAPQTLLHLRAGQNLPAFRLENSEATGAIWQVTSASDGQFRLTEVGAATRFVVEKATGNIGIGTGAPTSRLHVAGNTLLGGTATINGNTSITGNASVTGNTTLTGTTTMAGNATVNGDMVVNGNIGAKYQDVAEWVDAAEPLENGSIVVIDPTTTNRVRAATKSYATAVAGAISPQPGIVLGERGEGNRVLVAQSGRVRVKADATFGAIKPGDLLVTSPTKGHVMRSKPVKMGSSQVHRPGTLVGKALEALPNGRGEILVLLTLQ
jgi:hypothetical protein